MPRFAFALVLLLVSVPDLHAQSVGSLVTTLPSDLHHLFSKQSAVILGSAAVVSIPLRPNDPAIVRHARSDGDGLGEIVAGGGFLGSAYLHGAAALGTFVAGRVTHSERTSRVGADLIRGHIVNAMLTDGLKGIAPRTRPDGDKYSFPSGHTSTAFTTATVLQRHLGWKVGVPAYVAATYVGASRVAEFRHFATDVIVGAGIGLTAGRAVTVNVHKQSVVVAPAVTRESIGFTASVN